MKFSVILFLCAPVCAQTWFSNVTKTPSTNSCAIHWTTAVPTLDYIKYGLSSGSYTKYTSTSTTYTTSKTVTIAGLSAGTTYHFRIVAGDVSKDWVTSLDFYCTTAKITAQHSVKLNWLASSSTGVTGYRVYRSTISGGYYGLLASVAGLMYTDQAVQSGVIYYYTIKAINSAGLLSTYSNQAKAAIP
jgi:fibronectin type 3 domain-containing protein